MINTHTPPAFHEIQKIYVPPPGIELGFRRPQRRVLTIILRWHIFVEKLFEIALFKNSTF